MTAGRRGCWGWAPPPLPPGPQDLPRDNGPDGAAGGLKPEYTAASGPRTFGSGPTTGTRSQTICYVRRGTGRVVIINYSFERFFLGQPSVLGTEQRIHSNLLLRVLSSKVQLSFESLIKGTAAPAADLRHYPHSVCDILVFFSNRAGDLTGQYRLN